MDKMGKLFKVIVLAKWYYSAQFGIQLSFDMHFAVKSEQPEIESMN